MKFISLAFAALVLAVTVSGCHVNGANYHVPKGYKTCTSLSPAACDPGYHCGFVEVDSYAVCIPNKR